MLLKLGLFSLIFLVLLLPQAQSSRARFLKPHSPYHTARGHHHATASHSSVLKPTPKLSIQKVAGRLNEKQFEIGNFDIAMVTSRRHQVHELGGMLDTPVSGPNPGGNSENLAVSVQNLLGNMLDTPVSSPNPGGNSESLLASVPSRGGNANTVASMLDTPVSGPNPGGNSNTLGDMHTAVSGPNPGGNAQVLTVSAMAKMPDKPVSGASPRGNSETLTNMLDTPVSGPNPGGNSATLGGMLDAAVSGPNRGGNSQILSAVSGTNPGGNSVAASSETLAASSGPNPGGNSESLVSSKDGRLFSAMAVPIGERDVVMLSAVSGPKPGSDSASSTSSKDDISKASSLGLDLSEKRAQSDTSTQSSTSRKVEAGTIFSELPSAPVPPSGPSPIHNSAVTNQGLFAERNLKRVLIGCEQEGEGSSAYEGRFNHSKARTNTMGAASLTSA